MTRVLTTTETLATAYAAANVNRPARGVNGTDHMILMRVAPVGRGGFGSGADGAVTSAQPALEIADPDPQIQEGYSSAAGLGLVLMAAGAGGLVTLGTILVRAFGGFLG